MAKLGRAASKGFVRGREAMRVMIAEEFDKLGSGRFTAYEVAELVGRMPGPTPEDVEAEEEESEKVLS